MRVNSNNYYKIHIYMHLLSLTAWAESILYVQKYFDYTQHLNVTHDDTIMVCPQVFHFLRIYQAKSSHEVSKLKAI